MVHRLQVQGEKILLPIIAFAACLVLSFVAGSLLLVPGSSKAVTNLNLVTPPELYLSTSGDVAIELTPTSTGAIAADSHTVTVGTNVPTGYSLTLATTGTPSLTTTGGNMAIPTVLANNTWGYALAGLGGFDTSYTTPTPAATSTWADPSAGETINKTSNSATSDITTVYYAAKADTSLPSGTYSNKVRYTATANISDISTPSIISVTPSSGTTAGGTVVEIVGTNFTVNDESVTTAVTIDGVNCASVLISSNTPTTGQDTIYCVTPVHAVAEAVDVVVTTWTGTVTSANGFSYIAPTATITTPTADQIFAAGTTSTTLTATTDIPATCYYGTAADPTAGMTMTGNTHTQTITGLTNDSVNIIYVRCSAGSGHSYGNQASVNFYVRAAVPAAPTLSPADGSTVEAGATTIAVVSATSRATCTWGEASGSYPNASGTSRTTTVGTNTLYYSCSAGSGSTQSDAVTGSWSYTGILPYAGLMQTITTANCPTVMSRANDARDDASYIVQKMADGKCWMLTDLAYGGGGTNTYGDAKSISNNEAYTYTDPYYMIPTDSNRTTGTTDPSTSTSGTGQYGYLYNWCAAMGAQTNTSACADATTPAPDTSISICPSGWRLPTSNTGGEFQLLTDAIGATTNGSSGGSTGSTNLRTTWLAMYSGSWYGSIRDQGSGGGYWSSTQYFATQGYHLYFASSVVIPSYGSSKQYGHAVRCVAV